MAAKFGIGTSKTPPTLNKLNNPNSAYFLISYNQSSIKVLY